MNRIQNLSFYSILFFIMQSAYAIVPVTISGPSPAIASSYSAGTSTTITYTITNNVPNKSLPISVNGISGPITRTTVTSDCGNALPAGPSTCAIGVVIAPTSANSGNSFNQTLSVNYQGRVPLTQNIAFSVPQTGTVFAVAGQDYTSTQPPLLVASTDGGASWAIKSNSIAGLTSDGLFSPVSCTGSGTNTVCVAVGTNNIGGSHPPLIVVSTDGGNTWVNKTIAQNGTFDAVSCIGSGASAVCAAGGYDSSVAPLLIVSTNGGNSWVAKSIGGLTSSGLYNVISCSGSGSSAVCIGAGQDTSAGGQPLLVVSADGANTWNVSSAALPAAGYFNGASCTGNGATAFCVAAGTNGAAPYLIASKDGGASWSVPGIDGILPASGQYDTAACTGTGSNAVCIAAGTDTDTAPGSPLLVVTNDGGTSWSRIPSGLPANGTFSGTSCTGSGSTAICFAAGQNFGASTSPLVVVSTDGGNHWTTKTIQGNPTSGYFNSVSCTGTGSSVSCIAAGQDSTGAQPPLLAMSTDGGNTWAVKNISNLPSNGVFIGSGSSSLGLDTHLPYRHFGVKSALEKIIKK